jgi:hypothetical protein
MDPLFHVSCLRPFFPKREVQVYYNFGDAQDEWLVDEILAHQKNSDTLIVIPCIHLEYKLRYHYPYF